MADQSGMVQEPQTRATGATKPERRRGASGLAKTPPLPAPHSRTSVLPAGTHVGRYEIVRLVGEGGMGIVYEAKDARLNRKVALKVLSPRLKCNRRAAKRFAIEAQAAARLVHPNVVRVYDFDMDGELPFMAMEFLDGRTLASGIAAGHLAFSRMADIMLGVCAGVYAAHQAGIVHRDLKPSNIFLCSDFQGREIAHVLDFGISKVGDLSGSDLTQEGDIVGTSQYLSPEQAAGHRRISDASDQYSLGVVMYECVTQRTPQQGEAMYSLLRNVSEGRRVSPRELRGDLPTALEAIIERAMSVRPKDRFASVYELGRALLPFASAEGQRQFDDYYRGGPAPETPSRSTPERRPAIAAPRQEGSTTVEQTEEPPAAWSQRKTRTSSSRDRIRRSGAGLAVESERTSRKLYYSLAIGAVLAVAALGALGFLLRP